MYRVQHINYYTYARTLGAKAALRSHANTKASLVSYFDISFM